MLRQSSRSRSFSTRSQPAPVRVAPAPKYSGPGFLSNTLSTTGGVILANALMNRHRPEEITEAPQSSIQNDDMKDKSCYIQNNDFVKCLRDSEQVANCQSLYDELLKCQNGHM